MRLRVLFVAALAALLSVSVAVASPPPGKGKPETTPPPGKGKPQATGTDCNKPKVTVVLKGTFTSLSGTTLPATLTMSVTHGNRWARAWVGGTALVTVDQTTKVRIDRRNGLKQLTDLMSGDWLLVQARVCKGSLVPTPTVLPDLTAVRMVAHQKKS
jgi:hypothetical protein